MVLYSYTTHEWSLPNFHWKFTALGRANRYWKYDGAIMEINSLNNESVGDYLEATPKEFELLVKCVFAAKEVRETRK